jgi:surface antigen/uncharacterized membrane protein
MVFIIRWLYKKHVLFTGVFFVALLTTPFLDFFFVGLQYLYHCERKTQMDENKTPTSGKTPSWSKKTTDSVKDSAKKQITNKAKESKVGKLGENIKDKKDMASKIKSAISDPKSAVMNEGLSTASNMASQGKLGEGAKNVSDKIEKTKDTAKKVTNTVDKAKKVGTTVSKVASTAASVAPEVGIGAGAMLLFLKLKAQLHSLVIGVYTNSAFIVAMGLFKGVTGAIGGAISAVKGFFAFASSAVSGLLSVSSSVANLIVGVSATTVMAATISPVAVGINHVVNRTDDSCIVQSVSASELPGGGSDANADWTQPDTQANKNAKGYWDYWVGKGFGGAAVAGVLGNIAHEGGFNTLDRAQGKGDGGTGTGLFAGVVPDGGGGGSYQFTPYTKFAPLRDKKWKDLKAQSDFVWASEVQNASWKKEYAHSTNAKDAAQKWMELYERPASTNHPERGDTAEQVYKLFGGDNVHPDDSLLGNTDDTANGNDSSAGRESSKAANCGADLYDSNEPDGSGTYTSAAGTAWKPNEVPDDVKKFIHDPKSAGLGYSNGNGWFNPGNQCVHFSSSYFWKIWGLGENDKVMVDYGAHSADTWAKHLGTESSKTPKAGAVASVPGNSPGGYSEYGHTYLVEHVFANGDILIAEQNWPDKSGASWGGDPLSPEGGHPNTWNFRIIKKEVYQNENDLFTVPKDGKLTWKN